MHRPSMSTIPNRRPKWAKNLVRYNAIMNSAITRAGQPGEDFGVDNFSYCPDKVSAWQFPDRIAQDLLPEELCEAAGKWALAGAAVDTAIARIEGLRGEAEERTWPAYSQEHLIASRKEEEQLSPSPYSPSVSGASSTSGDGDFDLTTLDSNTSTASTAATSLSSSPAQTHQPPKLNTAVSSTTTPKKSTQLPSSITSKPGMETPPETPIAHFGSESGARSPALHFPTATQITHATPDAAKLSAQLSPLISPSQPILAASPTTPTTSFSCSSSSSISSGATKVDQVAWQNYTNALTAEFQDLRTVALPRLKGYEREVDRYLVELRAEPPRGLGWETAETIVAFAEWWRREAKQMVQGRVARVEGLRMPRLEDVLLGGA